MTTTRLVAASLAALLCALPAAAQTRAKITIGKDTTRILGPLRPDGTVDYVAAVNQRASKGVTKDNNAFVGMLGALGPEILNEKIRDRALKILGVTLPTEGHYFTEYAPMEQPQRGAFKQACENPWAAADHAAIAKWLEANRAPLAAFIAASKRPRYYLPLLEAEDMPPMLAIQFPMLGPVLGAGRALGVRANLAVRQGRVDDARRDILAMRRVGALMGQDLTLISRLVGIGICALADKATINLATSGKLSGPKARAILADLESAGPGPGVVSAADTVERFLNLSLIQSAAVDPAGLRKGVKAYAEMAKDLFEVPRDIVAEIIRTDFKGVDFNDILRRANFFYDFQLAGMRRPTYAEQLKAQEALRAGLEKTKSLARNPADDKPVGAESVQTRRAGTVLLSLYLSNLSRAQTMVERARTRHHVARLAVALAACRAEKGGYPAALSALAPTYVKSIPQDFFSGKDLIYRHQGAGYLLYSVGENTRDDGGVWDRPKGDDLSAKADR